MKWSAVAAPLRLGFRRMGARKLRVALVTLALTCAGAIVGMSSVIGAVALAESVRTQLSSSDPVDRSIVIRDRLDPGRARDSTGSGGVARSLQRAHRGDAGRSGLRSRGARGRPRIHLHHRGRRRNGCRSLFWTDSRRRVHPTPPRARRCPWRDRRSAQPSACPPRPARSYRCSWWAPAVCPHALTGGQDHAGATFVLPEVSGTAFADALAGSSATVYMSAALDPEKVAPCDLGPLLTDLRATAVTVERESSSATLTAPLGLLQELERLGDAASTRLLIVASQGAALVLAFAAFAASISRRDVELGRDQLSNLAAGRFQLAAVRATESLVPALAALIIVVAGLRLSLVPLSSGRDQRGTAGRCALPWTIVITIAGLELVGAGILFVAVAPARRGRFGLGGLELAAAVALVVVIWQAFASGGFDPGSSTAANPVLLLVPGLAVLVAGIVLLRVLPLVFRGAERVARHSTVSVRLALLAAARNPAGSSAVTTFLAVAVGSAIFGLNYAATLDQQAHDEAQFSVGAVARTINPAAATSQGAPLTADQDSAPALRLLGTASSGTTSGLPFELLALPGDQIANVSGWRDSFSDLSLATIGSRLQPAPVRLVGANLPPDATEIELVARDNTDDERTAVVHLLLPTGAFTSVSLGALNDSWQTLQAPLPDGTAGAQAVGTWSSRYRRRHRDPGHARRGGRKRHQQRCRNRLHRPGGANPLRARADARPCRLAGRGDTGFRGQLTSATFDDGPTQSGFTLELNSTAVPLIRPGVNLTTPAGAGDPISDEAVARYVIPVLAGPAFAAAAVDGVLDVDLRGQRLRLQVTADASLFPTILDDPTAFAVADYDTLFAALNVDAPGTAVPTEAWYLQGDPGPVSSSGTVDPRRRPRAHTAHRSACRGHAATAHVQRIRCRCPRGPCPDPVDLGSAQSGSSGPRRVRGDGRLTQDAGSQRAGSPAHDVLDRIGRRGDRRPAVVDVDRRPRCRHRKRCSSASPDPNSRRLADLRPLGRARARSRGRRHRAGRAHPIAGDRRRKAAGMTSAINAKDAFVLYRASYGDVAALRGLSLSIESGESVAVLGPSGAGKSTFLSLCAGTSRPSSGEVSVLDLDIGTASKGELARLRRRDIGVVRQHFHTALPGELTIEEIVALPLRLLGTGGQPARDRPAGCSISPDWAVEPAPNRSSSPVANSNESRSAPRWSNNLGFCSPTNQPGSSTQPPRWSYST